MPDSFSGSKLASPTLFATSTPQRVWKVFFFLSCAVGELVEYCNIFIMLPARRTWDCISVKRSKTGVNIYEQLVDKEQDVELAVDESLLFAEIIYQGCMKSWNPIMGSINQLRPSTRLNCLSQWNNGPTFSWFQFGTFGTLFVEPLCDNLFVWAFRKHLRFISGLINQDPHPSYNYWPPQGALTSCFDGMLATRHFLVKNVLTHGTGMKKSPYIIHPCFGIHFLSKFQCSLDFFCGYFCWIQASICQARWWCLRIGWIFSVTILSSVACVRMRRWKGSVRHCDVDVSWILPLFYWYVL